MCSSPPMVIHWSREHTQNVERAWNQPAWSDNPVPGYSILPKPVTEEIAMLFNSIFTVGR